MEAIRAINLHGSSPVRDMEWKPCEPSKNKKDPPKQVLLVAASPQPVNPAFYQSLSPQPALQDQLVDDIPEMLHRGGDGLHGIVIQ